MNTHTRIDQAEAAGFEAPGIDLDNVALGQTFQATWGFKNTGTTPWRINYKFAYSGTPHPETKNDPHSAMAPLPAYALSELGVSADVPPGATIHLTLTLTVPATAAAHATTWQLQTPDGRSFGPLRWMRAIVKEKAAAPTPQIPETFDPDGWRTVIWRITSVFESGTPDGRADAYQNADAGIISFGKHQATLQSGNLERVLNAYFRRSSSAASQALQQEFAQRVAQKEESLRHDARFKQFLQEAANEPAMSEAQDEIFAQNFYRPIVEEARKLGIRTPLGLACLYDTRIQGGLDRVLELVAQKLGTPGPASTVDESTWIRTFLDEREAWLRRVADSKEQQGLADDARFLRTSTFRVAELRQLLNSGNLDLAGEFRVRNKRIRGLREKISAAMRREPQAREPEEQSTIDLLPYIKGDGRQYEIKNAWGSQERLQTQEDNSNFYHVKNAQWEQFFYDDNFIYRDIDTSPGNNRFYRQKDADLPRGSRWLRRHMAIGETHTQARRVQFFNKADGSPSAQNSGDVTDTIKLVAHHAKHRFPTGIELNDVIELEWINGRERYFYAKNYGLVGWERKHDDPHTPPWSAISEIHQPGTREPFIRERLTISW